MEKKGYAAHAYLNSAYSLVVLSEEWTLFTENKNLMCLYYMLQVIYDLQQITLLKVLCRTIWQCSHNRKFLIINGQDIAWVDRQGFWPITVIGRSLVQNSKLPSSSGIYFYWLAISTISTLQSKHVNDRLFSLKEEEIPGVTQSVWYNCLTVTLSYSWACAKLIALINLNIVATSLQWKSFIVRC